MSDDKTPDQVISEQAEPQPGIEFMHGGNKVQIELPFKVPVWYWILTHPATGIDPNESNERMVDSLIAAIGLNTRRIVSIATGLTEKELTEGLDDAELERVEGEVAEQLGRELTASAPFSHFREATLAVKRLALVARGASGSRGLQPLPQSAPKSAAGRRRKSRG